MEKLKLLIAGGGTGGHLFPGIAVAEAIAEIRASDIRFVGTSRGLETKVIPQKGWPLYLLPVSGLYRVGLVKKIFSLLKLPLALAKSIKILLQFRPHLVIGVGGYASGPLLLAALLLRFPTVIQEQNASPGMTNRLLGRWVPLSFVPFTGLESLFKNPVVVGNPIRQEIQKIAAQKDSRNPAPFTVVLVGGSQGARVLNKALTAALPILAKEKVRLFHQSGVLDYQEVLERYSRFPELESEVLPFVEDVGVWLHQAHLVLSRAGSMVNEICAVGRASILVPIPHTSGDHQEKNAKILESKGAALVINQSELTAKGLAQAIIALKNHPSRRIEMEKASKSLVRLEAAQEIALQALQFYHLEET